MDQPPSLALPTTNPRPEHKQPHLIIYVRRFWRTVNYRPPNITNHEPPTRAQATTPYHFALTTAPTPTPRKPSHLTQPFTRQTS